MGASLSGGTQLTSEQNEAYASFSDTELKEMSSTYSRAMETSKPSTSAGIRIEEFRELFHLKSLDEGLLSKLFQLALPRAQNERAVPSRLSMPDLVLLKYRLEKSSAAGRAAILWSLMDCSHQLEKDLTRWADELLRLAGHPPPDSAFLAAVCSSIFQSSKDELSFQKALKTWPGVLDVMTRLTVAFPSGEVPPPAAPHIDFDVTGPKASLLLLSHDWRALLASLLPSQQRTAWQLLFNSDIHGKSFSSFLGKVTGRGPSLLVVRDKGGAVFGGYAADAWEKKGVFYGQPTCFLFRLLPSFSVHFSSGINTNFQWCGYQFKEVPNGVGFGGQSGYFALLVKDDIDTGMSRPAATFESPCLASSQVFEIDCVECWLVEESEEEQDRPQGSVMDRFKEDNAILQMHGKINHSDGYRKDEPVE